MNALRSHLIPFDFPIEKWSAYYEARLVLVGASKKPIPVTVFTAIAGRQKQFHRDGCNLRLPINPLLKNASQTVFAPAANGSDA